MRNEQDIKKYRSLEPETKAGVNDARINLLPTEVDPVRAFEEGELAIDNEEWQIGNESTHKIGVKELINDAVQNRSLTVDFAQIKVQTSPITLGGNITHVMLQNTQSSVIDGVDPRQIAARNLLEIYPPKLFNNELTKVSGMVRTAASSRDMYVDPITTDGLLINKNNVLQTVLPSPETILCRDASGTYRELKFPTEYGLADIGKVLGVNVNGDLDLSTIGGGSNVGCRISHIEATGVDGGTVTAGDWNVVPLNTLDDFGLEGVTVEPDGGFSLPESVYLLNVQGVTVDTGQTQFRIIRENAIVSDTGFVSAPNTASNVNQNHPNSFNCLVDTRGEGDVKFYLQVYVDSTEIGDGFGYALNRGTQLEHYSNVTVTDMSKLVLDLNTDIPDGTLTQKGIVQLNNAINLDIETMAATPSAVKAVNDKADANATDIEALRVEFLKYNNPTDWSQVGNSLPIAGKIPALAALSSNTVVFIDDDNRGLRTYSFDGTNWSQVGNSLPIAGVTSCALAALSSDTVALIDSVNEELRTYSFDGVDWSQVGNSLPITGVTYPALAALSSDTVALIDSVNVELRTYSFDGTDWSQVGNSLPIADTFTPALAALSPNTVAYIDADNRALRTYSFDGIDWSQVGNSLPIVGVSSSALAALNSNTVAFIDSGNGELRTYSFDGPDWSQVGNSLYIAGVSSSALAALSPNTVAFIDDGNDELRTYEWVNSGCPPTKVW